MNQQHEFTSLFLSHVYVTSVKIGFKNQNIIPKIFRMILFHDHNIPRLCQPRTHHQILSNNHNEWAAATLLGLSHLLLFISIGVSVWGWMKFWKWDVGFVKAKVLVNSPMIRLFYAYSIHVSWYFLITMFTLDYLITYFLSNKIWLLGM